MSDINETDESKRVLNCPVNPNFAQELEEAHKHSGIICDVCQLRIYKGNRWNCIECPDYDMYEKCINES